MGPVPVALARPLRYIRGIGGYLLLGLLPASLQWLEALFVLASVILALTTAGRPGLPGLVSGEQLEDARVGGDPTLVGSPV